MLKTDVIWPSHRRFKSRTEWEPLGFFSDCLCNSNSFDIMLGFFSSTAINILAAGFANFLSNGGKMRLIANNILSQEDKSTILNAKNNATIHYDLNNLKELRKTLAERDNHFFECLAWLIKNNRIEIKIIAPKSGIGISHTKLGLFSDDLNTIAFDGSCNFSKTALINNIESITVACDWDGEVGLASVKEVERDFENTFTGTNENVVYLDPTQIISDIEENFGNKELTDLLEDSKRFIKQDLLELNISEQTHKTLLVAEEKINYVIVKEPSALEIENSNSTPTFPYTQGPREYQEHAFQNWKANGQKGLFAMATGTGKTITSLNCLLEIYKRCGYYKAIILVPTITLLEQWVGECKKFNFNNIFKVYSKNSKWKNDIDILALQEKLGGKEENISYIIISTYASISKDNVFTRLNAFSKTRLLLIADEAHNMGSEQIRNKLKAIKYGRRIGLSATPERQYDDEGNKALLSFFRSEEKYTYEYSMKEAIENGVLCRYLYYPHIVRLTDLEMDAYAKLSIKIAKFSTSDGALKKGDSILTALLLKRKRIIHKASNKILLFEKIINELYKENGTLKHTLVYVPEGNEPDDTADIFSNKEFLTEDIDSQHLIDQYSAIVRNVYPRATVKQFTATSEDRENILEEFAAGRLEVLTSMKCLDEGVDVPQSRVAIFCSSTGNPRQFIQRRGRILRQSKATHKHLAIIHDLVVVPEINSLTESYNLEKNLIKTELNRVRNFALLAENCNDTLQILNNTLNHYNLSLFINGKENGQ